ncbi:MAG: dinuclear metal center YbgI/SA1388 family protein [Myxococcota bacterium]|jgi:dinuclear metal center YbgI/SA1388 family protein
MLPIPLATLTEHLATTLDPTGMTDYGPNGLQVDAAEPVRRIVTGVTANLALINAAAEWDADLLLVHHGIYWNGASATVTGPLGRRIRRLLDAKMSLVAYHLPLDAHPTLGNAHGLARHIGLGQLQPAFGHKGTDVGCVGVFDQPTAIDAVKALLCDRVNPETRLFTGGPANVTRVGVVTGGAARDVHGAIALGCDLFITGEAGEYSQATAQEEAIHFAACGHHRSERFGPQALADHLANTFPALETRYIDIDNPI